MIDLIINSIRYHAVYRWILSFYRKKGEFLDFGCGKGEFVSYLLRKGWRGHGIDSEAKTAFFSSLEDLQKNSKDAFDIITLNFSLEHCNDPMLILKELCASLAPGGLIFIRVPNTMRNDKFFSFQIKTGQHLNYFTLKSLKDLLEKCGFSILKIDTRFCITSALTAPCSIFPELDPMDWLYEKRIAVKFRKGLCLGILCFIFFPYELIKSQIGRGAIIHAAAQKNT